MNAPFIHSVNRCLECFNLGAIIKLSCHIIVHIFVDIYTTSVEKAMAPHSSTLAWKIPWMEEPGGLQSVGSLSVGHD